MGVICIWCVTQKAQKGGYTVKRKTPPHHLLPFPTPALPISAAQVFPPVATTVSRFSCYPRVILSMYKPIYPPLPTF